MGRTGNLILNGMWGMWKVSGNKGQQNSRDLYRVFISVFIDSTSTKPSTTDDMAA